MNWPGMYSLIIGCLIRYSVCYCPCLDAISTCFLAVVLEWRRIKQQRLTCTTALTVRSPMGRRSVSY